MNRNRIVILAIIGGIVLLVVAAIGWWLVSPLFLNRTVAETFPEVPAAEELAAMSEEEKAAIEQEVLAESAEMPDTVMEEPMPDMPEDGPVIIWQGQFEDADNFHQGSGSATIYELADSSYVLRLENFEVTNGPDLHVHLSGSSFPLEQAEVMTEPAVDLGPLKGNIGDQNYDIPAGVDISSVASVVIYCQPFHVTFAVAPLS